MPASIIRQWLLCLSLSLLVFSSLKSNAAELWETLPKSDRAIHDFAGIVNDSTERNLERFLRDAYKSLDTPIVVVTLTSMQGGQIDDFTNRLYEKWGIGTKPANKGVLFLVSVSDRKMRIETGYGTEPIITDTFSSSLIREVAAPHFKQNDYTGGIDQVSRAIAGQISQAEGIPIKGAVHHTVKKRRNGSGGNIVQVIFIIIVIISSVAGGNSRRSRTRRGIATSILLSSGGFRGGSGSGFGSSSGGFGGFGGGFSGGGGASGGW